MSQTPEQKARQTIDRLLIAAGWTIQDHKTPNLHASAGVAICEPSLQTGEADYLLFVDGRAIGVIEAKRAGHTLSGAIPQAHTYSRGIPTYMKTWLPDRTLPFRYISTGVETIFVNDLDPKPRSRPLFAFHRPETLRTWVKELPTLRARFQTLPVLATAALWRPQITAIQNLEASLAQDKPRALIQMATGSGKTFTAINFIYRLIKYANARRVLFLVDRTNLGDQTLKEFQNFTTPDDGRKFTELYNVQQLKSSHIDADSRVVITTIQRLYSILCGNEQIDPDIDLKSLFQAEEEGVAQQPVTVSYYGKVPIETFDIIVTDECHRSIYNVWRDVLLYFDAHLIGLTATPTAQTIGFFNENRVMAYTHRDAVADGINVQGDVFRIRTRITEQGSTVPTGEWVTKLERQTRRRQPELLGQDFAYAAPQLGADVITPSQIRLVINTFRNALFRDLFPERAAAAGPPVVPKTLIFAHDDNHAEEIVTIVKDIFNEGDDFCQKITYQVTKTKPATLIAAFRTNFHPRIAVTVDMIATGTDIKAIEILIFMRMVKSRSYFEQMLGRGTRIISTDDLKRVTGNADSKDRFIIVDAVGVTEQEQVEIAQPLDRQRTVALPDLLKQIAYGAADADTLSTLASRLARLQHKVTAQDDYTIATSSGGLALSALVHELLSAIDPDQHVVAAMQATGHPEGALSAADIAAAADQLLQAAAARYATRPVLCTTLIDFAQRTFVVNDDVSRDVLLKEGFDADATARNQQLVANFEAYLATHKDEIAALSVFYQQPYARQQLTRTQLKELADQLRQPPNSWTTEALWRAYAQLEKDQVRGLNTGRVLTDIVALVRHAIHSDELLQPYPELVQQRYQDWLAAQQAAGRTFTAAQRWWLDHIAERIGLDLAISPADLNQGDFRDRGGTFAAIRELGPTWQNILNELNTALIVT